MSMISEQVKRLRKLANQWKHNDVAGFNLIFDACDTIEALSAKVRDADRPTGWIPVSERLPEETSKPVLISGNYKGLGVYAVDIARYNGGMWQYDGFTFPDCDILAWMPLPEPYREESEVEE